MWGGLDIFVSIETLVSFTIPSSCSSTLPHKDAVSGAVSSEGDASGALPRPGKPSVRNLHFIREGRLVPVFVFPNATLFLQVLCSSGNKVHLMTPWGREDTTTILKSSGWVSYLADARRVSLVPGTSQFNFSSLGVNPADYTRTVLIVEDASRWDSATALQLIEVPHSREVSDGADSMELLYALSRSIFFSEWFLRYPASSIASCAALSNTVVFSYCRFFFDGVVPDPELMRLATFHGARVVSSAAEATHIVALPPPPTDDFTPSTSSASSSSSSSSSEAAAEDGASLKGVTGGRVDSTDTDTSDSEEEENSSTLPAGSKRQSAQGSTAERSLGAVRVGRTELTTKAVPDPPAPTAISRLRAGGPPHGGNPSVPVVSPLWVYRCIRALRLLPYDEIPNSSNNASPSSGDAAEQDDVSADVVSRADTAEMTRLMGVLLAILLPPSDARPLLWSTLHAIASQNGYDADALMSSTTPGTSPLKVTAMRIIETLTGPRYCDVVEVRLLTAPSSSRGSDGATATSSSSARSRGVTVSRLTLDSLKISASPAEVSRIALHRCERRRDKEAVFAHLQLIASQFLYSFDFVQRQRRQEHYQEAGTQTGNVLHAFMSTMTEGLEAEVASPVGKDAVAREPPAKKVAVPTASARAALPKDIGGKTCASAGADNTPELFTEETVDAVGEEEWRHQIKNVEGKLLTSPDHYSLATNMRGPSKVQWDDPQRHLNAYSTSTVKGMAVSATEWNSESSAERRATLSAREDDSDVAQLPSSPLSKGSTEGAQPGVSLFASPPPTVSLRSSSSSLLPLPAMPDQVAPSREAGTDPSAAFTACFIPTSSLTASQRFDFYVFLSSLPRFRNEDEDNRVVLLSDGALLEFDSHKDASDFLRIEFIEFLSLKLPIYPAFEESSRLEALKQTIRELPADPLPVMTESSPTQSQGWCWPTPTDVTAVGEAAGVTTELPRASQSRGRQQQQTSAEPTKPVTSQPRSASSLFEPPATQREHTRDVTEPPSYTAFCAQNTESPQFDRRKRERDIEENGPRRPMTSATNDTHWSRKPDSHLSHRHGREAPLARPSELSASRSHHREENRIYRPSRPPLEDTTRGSSRDAHSRDHKRRDHR